MTDETIDALIRAGLALEKEGNEQQAIDYFMDLVARFPDNPLVAFEAGGVYDSAGHEGEAVLYYKRALELGLPEAYFPKIAVQLGSSLRNLGQYEEATRILSEGRERFPEDRAVRAFLALALYSGGRPADALREMLELTLDVDNFYPTYTRSLRNYAKELRDQ